VVPVIKRAGEWEKNVAYNRNVIEMARQSPSQFRDNSVSTPGQYRLFAGKEI
jgi:hypothetical protein